MWNYVVSVTSTYLWLVEPLYATASVEDRERVADLPWWLRPNQHALNRLRRAVPGCVRQMGVGRA